MTVNISRRQWEQVQRGVPRQPFYLTDGWEHTLTYLVRGQITQSYSKRGPALCIGRENDTKTSRKNLNIEDSWGSLSSLFQLIPILAVHSLSDPITGTQLSLGLFPQVNVSRESD